ncbi:hypothetical protein MYK68_13985 [Gordonia sp. PP30]|uniref:phage tail tube protein n=1 Tax=Gordonia sp. PP30 TaxID=2935861 RepID=UPI001FFFAE39|nr:hypothetical protein [Gordonia sp. PP30]UQE73840.1 hypothetical protein MYK68_13985 [Gordonia sp. PP30]
MANSANVTAVMPRATGAIRNAPLGTAGPDDADTDLDAAFVDQGYVGEDGITEANSRDTDAKKALGGDTVRVLQTGYDNTFTIPLIEDKNVEVLRRVFGADNVIVSGDNVTVRKNKKILPREAWVIDLEDGEDLIRTYIPEGQVTEVSDVTLSHGDIVTYELTVTAYASDVIDGDTSRQYRYRGVLPAPEIVKVFTLDGGVTAYTVTVDGQTTASIGTKTAAALRSALEALPNVGAGNVTVTGSSGGPLTATFTVAVTAVSASGTGGTVTVA